MGRSEDMIEQAYSKEELAEMLKRNKYFNLGDDFDPINILVDGKIPEFKSQGDKFRCVMTVAKFVRARDSLDGISEGLANFVNSLEIDMFTLFMKQQTLSMMQRIVDTKLVKNQILDLYER